MPFTGKATFSAGATLPEHLDDISDIVGIVSPFETPLLAHLGDPPRAARSTVHEWMEDALLPNADAVDGAHDDVEVAIAVLNPARFREGDILRVDSTGEMLLVTAVAAGLTVMRGYGGSTAANIADAAQLTIIGNAALEGDDAPDARFTNRSRQTNYTQIFTAAVEVSGSQQAAHLAAVHDELDYQKQLRLREQLRDLENTVLNGVAPAANPEGSSSVRRSMNGVIHYIENAAAPNVFINDTGGFPAGGGAGSDELTEQQLNTAMRETWQDASSHIDTIVVGGFQKRRINSFITASRGYDANDDKYRDLVSVYESDFGVCRVVLSRWMPADTVLLLDSSRIDVLPLDGRSFHYKPLADTGDRQRGQVIGEYTVEVRNGEAHALIRGLATN